MQASVRPAKVPETAVRVLIVDDSAVARAVMSRAIDEHSRLFVAAALPSAETALDFLDRRRGVVDVIVLDVNMPGLSGIQALPRLMAASGGARVLLVSSACGIGAEATIAGLAAGAADTLEKPIVRELSSRFADMLCERLERLAQSDLASVLPTPEIAGLTLPDLAEFDAVAIGASTGGIHALGQLVGALPRDFAPPVLITQHLPPVFMPHFAGQLTALAGRPCRIAEDGETVNRGSLLIAPGDAHLSLERSRGRVVVRLDRGAAISGCLPSVDPMFAAAAVTYGARLLAVVLSGMGRDGSIGAQAVAAAGGQLLAQDEISSVVWGMPGAVVRQGLATAILPPDAIGRAMAEHGRRW